MKNVVVLLSLVAVSFGQAALAEARGHHGHRHHHFWRHRYVIVDPFWGPPGWYPYWGYPRPVVIREEPPVVYIQRPDNPPAAGNWYYCFDSKAYYPDVRECPRGWVQVAPRASPPQR